MSTHYSYDQRGHVQASWDTASSDQKYSTDYFAAGRHSSRHNSHPVPKSFLKSLGRSLYKLFGSASPKHKNPSVDSLAYSDHSIFEAEMLDEDNMAWGPPSRKRKARSPKASKDSPSSPNSDTPRFCF